MVVQLVAPRIAEQVVRDRIGSGAQVEHVEVHAFPAVELLWQHADRVVVRLRSYTASIAKLRKLLAQARDADDIDASAKLLKTGPLTLRDGVLHKRGNQLVGSGHVTNADVRAALPPGMDVQPVIGADGQLSFEGTAAFLGIGARLRLRLVLSDGNLSAQPDIPLGGIANVPLFADPHLAIDSLVAQPAADGFTVTLRAHER
jgi:hypothetical protein